MSDLTTPGTREADILKRISIARGTSEPEKSELTEPQDAVDVSSEEAPVNAEQPEESGQLVEAEEPASIKEESQPESDTDEDFYVDFKGREISFKQIEEWESGHLMQSDYTRKTQVLSDDRKAFDVEREQFTSSSSKLGELTATLEAMIAEDDISAEDLAEMREFEPEQYIKRQEKLAKRKELLVQAKQVTPQSNVNTQEERTKLWNANPKWMEDGKQTQAFTDDLNLMQTYALDQGYTVDEISGLQCAHHFQTLIDASKYQKLIKGNAVVEKKVRKAPVSTKPNQTVKTPAIEAKIKEVKAKLKRTGSNADFQELRRLQRQLKG